MTQDFRPHPLKLSRPPPPAFRRTLTTETVQAIASQAWDFAKNATPGDIGRQYGRIATHIVAAKVTSNLTEVFIGKALRGQLRFSLRSLWADESGTVKAGEIADAINRGADSLDDAAELSSARQRIAAQIRETQRRRGLGTDADGVYRSIEESGALELEQKLGITLIRDASGQADWLRGKTSYDHFWPKPTYFDAELKNGNIWRQLKRHVDGIKTDFVVIDTFGFNADQLNELKMLIAQLSKSERDRIIDLRGNLGL